MSDGLRGTGCDRAAAGCACANIRRESHLPCVRAGHGRGLPYARERRDRALRALRYPREQCRRAAHLAIGGIPRVEMGPDPRCQPQRLLPYHESRTALDATNRLGPRCQRSERAWSRRLRQQACLRRCQARSGGSDQGGSCGSSRRYRDHRQRHLPWVCADASHRGAGEAACRGQRLVNRRSGGGSGGREDAHAALRDAFRRGSHMCLPLPTQRCADHRHRVAARRWLECPLVVVYR
mmetsp:Transcript_58340/g.130039  ORF Transcript_58340/g.130039 Transcript_58340/m.130039 type:complete len:237 (-) Transcript_58340:503-1213(-)